MPGMIMLWYGSVATIPSGWVLCDGNNGTPNLRGRYVKGAHPSSPQPGVTGGANAHTHDFTGDGHAHDMSSGLYIDNVYSAGEYGHTTETSPASGTTDSESNEPQFHCLCYIMKTPIP